MHADVLNTVLSLLRAGHAAELRRALASIEQGLAPVGPFVSGKAALAFLIDRMVLTAKPNALWLFGSRAREEARTERDFDFLEIFTDDRSGEIDRLRDRLADAVQGSGIGVDIAVCTETEFESFKTMAGSLIRTVHEQGRKVYEAGGRRRKVPA